MKSQTDIWHALYGQQYQQKIQDEALRQHQLTVGIGTTVGFSAPQPDPLLLLLETDDDKGEPHATETVS